MAFMRLPCQTNLLVERIDPCSVFVTGNTVVDAMFWVLEKIDASPELQRDIVELLNACLPFAWQQEKFVLITGHRRENFGDGFLQICHALRDLAERYTEVHFVYPVHLNPNVQKPVYEILENLPNVHLIRPLEYEPFLYLLKHCYLVLTDSGGIQEEAPSLGKPVLVMRDVTERPEAVDAGTVRLVGAKKSQIVQNIIELIDDPQVYAAMSRAHNPYGDGQACNRIVQILKGVC